MRKKRFLTIFLPFEEVHMYKDVGMIPYYLAKYFFWNSDIICFKKNAKLKNKEYLDNVNIIEISSGSYSIVGYLKLIKFLMRNLHLYDFVNIYHPGKFAALIVLLMKIIKPKGKIYIKLDMNRETFLEHIEHQTSIKQKLLLMMRKFIYKNIDLCSVESEIFYNRLNCIEYIKNKLILIRNGTYRPVKGYVNNKEKIVITVGRIGAPEKNHELLIRAITQIPIGKLKSWQFHFIGPVEDKFHSYVTKILNSKKDFSKKIIFHGNISNRQELFNLYSRSSVFCMTSNTEGSPISLSEALITGNYPVLTNFPSAVELNENWEIGKIFCTGDDKKLSQILIDIIEEKIDLKEERKKIESFANDNLDWYKIVRTLNEFLINFSDEDKVQ